MRARVAIVTGAGSGIGAAVATRLATDDLLVIAADRNGAAAEATAASIGARGDQAASFAADVTNMSDCSALVQRAQELGDVVVLVNVAGVMQDDDTAETISDQALQHLFNVNVFAVFRLARLTIPLLRTRGGVILNVSSVHAWATQAGVAAYAASKGAIVALTRQMAIEYAAAGIRVVGLAPGAVDTPLTTHNLTRRGETLATSGFVRDPHSTARLIDPEEIAEAAAFLVSRSASAINGETLIADSGLIARLL